jgi:major membrane immunogen (membrane-anchored lipoprotein)
MIKIRDLEKNISDLPPKKLAEFRRWYEKFDAAKWDKQFEVDVNGGKLNAAANKALRDFKNGRSKEL